MRLMASRRAALAVTLSLAVGIPLVAAMLAAAADIGPLRLPLLGRLEAMAAEAMAASPPSIRTLGVVMIAVGRAGIDAMAWLVPSPLLVLVMQVLGLRYWIGRLLPDSAAGPDHRAARLPWLPIAAVCFIPATIADAGLFLAGGPLSPSQSPVMVPRHGASAEVAFQAAAVLLVLSVVASAVTGFMALRLLLLRRLLGWMAPGAGARVLVRHAGGVFLWFLAVAVAMHAMAWPVLAILDAMQPQTSAGSAVLLAADMLVTMMLETLPLLLAVAWIAVLVSMPPGDPPAVPP